MFYDPDKRLEKKYDRFEEGRVKYILKVGSLQKYKWDLLKYHEKRTGMLRLRLCVLSQLLDFPIYFRGTVTKLCEHTVSLGFLFRGLKKSLLFDEFADDFRSTSTTEEADRPFGLVFRAAGFREGLVMHNGHNFFTVGASLMFNCGTPEAPYQIYVEPFARVVRAIFDSGWKPMQLPSSGPQRG